MSPNILNRKATINFLLNGVEVEIDFNSNADLSPHMTVMQYLRDYAKLTGTKEGCGIGDCGACTICIIEEDASKNIVISSVNGCLIMLGMIDNKHVITVEGVAQNGKLHPVQLSLAEKRGAQCGFCSPGMVMSAYAHYLNRKSFTRAEIESSLSGNLCRCTGYESILQALMDVKKYEGTHEKFKLPLQKDSKRELYLESGENVYIKPIDLDSLLKYKKQFPHFTLACGASDLSVKIKTENPKSVKIIDISDTSELKAITINEDNLIIGGNTSIEKAREVLSRYYPQISEYLATFASLQIRNKASMAGSVAGASPVGDIMPLLLALNAKIKLSSANSSANSSGVSSRIIESRDFNISYRKHVMLDNEIIESFVIPLPKGNSKLFCYKQSKRKDIDISTLTFCIGFVLENGIIADISTGFGGMAAIPCPALKIEAFLAGKPFTEDTFSKARSLIKEDFTPISDMRGSAEYRQIVAENMLIKCYNDLK